MSNGIRRFEGWNTQRGGRPPLFTAPASGLDSRGCRCLWRSALPTRPAGTVYCWHGPTGTNERTQPPYLSPHGLLTCILSQKLEPNQPRRPNPAALFRARAQPPFRPFNPPGCSHTPKRELGGARKEAKLLSLGRLLQNLAQKLVVCARLRITGPARNASVIQCYN